MNSVQQEGQYSMLQPQIATIDNHFTFFKLYETHSNFYMMGRDQKKTCWRVLKINRLEPAELNIVEDPSTYSEHECRDLERRLHEGNKSTGGFKLVTICYGIIGFVKFLGPYYMLLITERKKIGAIGGHSIYSIAKSEMIPILNSCVLADITYSKNENRYKKLICAIDLTKDFFFSYSYRIMHCFQKNIHDDALGAFPYESMFVWNEYLTHGIRKHVKNSLWTVALVHGFFKQVKFYSVSGRAFLFTLIARRSRHYAGPRFLKRGVNQKGRVANDVETEQIVLEDAPEGFPVLISSVVQNRGSIPLFWSQETSRLSLRPDIILWKKDPNYDATRLHFKNLVGRYGNPIIILNLIKTQEKKPRESILCAEFANAIEFINKDLTYENRLKFLHRDISKYSRDKATYVLGLLCKVAEHALDLTGICYCRMSPTSWPQDNSSDVDLVNHDSAFSSQHYCCNIEGDGNLKRENSGGTNVTNGNCSKPLRFQTGVLRTNCIDCLDRTNVAQYACGLVALAHQLYALGYSALPQIDVDTPLAHDLMEIYENMGDTLALQYGGSAAHNKIFSEIRGQWKVTIQTLEFFRTLQRYFSNAYMDVEKQNAINVFLGHFQPQEGKPSLWELDSDQHYNVGHQSPDFGEEKFLSILKRSLSVGPVLYESNSPMDHSVHGRNRVLSKSVSEISSDSNISCSGLQSSHSMESDQLCSNGHGETFLKFVDLEWLSSSGNSCEEEIYERSSLINLLNSPCAHRSKVFRNELQAEPITTMNGAASSTEGGEPFNDILSGFSDSFVNWVTYGGTLFP